MDHDDLKDGSSHFSNMVRVDGTEEEGYAELIVVIQLLFDNDDCYNYIILIIVGSYWSDQMAGGSDFTIFLWNGPHAAPGFLIHKNYTREDWVILIDYLMTLRE